MPNLIYISGAITGATAEEMALFTEAKTDLMGRGFAVFNPPDHDVPDAATSQDRWRAALCRDTAVISRCKGIAVLRTFGRSKGALLEVFNAVCLGKEIVLLTNQHDEWRDNILEEMRRVQAELWRNVERSRFTHHTDLP
jgi:uncharacterized protein DUF4406